MSFDTLHFSPHLSYPGMDTTLPCGLRNSWHYGCTERVTVRPDADVITCEKCRQSETFAQAVLRLHLVYDGSLSKYVSVLHDERREKEKEYDAARENR
jgi:hypothetical protein